MHLENRAAEDPKILAVLNKAPRFWQDQRYIAPQTTIIFLGKIFDNDKSAHNIDKTLRTLMNEQEYFSKEMLRKRIIETSGNFEGIDTYIENASELNSHDLKTISKQIKKAKAIWKPIKFLRDKRYGHNEMLSDSELNELYKAVKNVDITNILQILLNVSNALWEAELNGLKPEFKFDYTRPIEEAKEDIEELIGSLLNPPPHQPQENTSLFMSNKNKIPDLPLKVRHLVKAASNTYMMMKSYIKN